MNWPRTRMCLVALLQMLLAASIGNAFEVVVIDPGHGGTDEGTAWYHVKEKDTTLAVARRLERILTENGFRAVLTRDADTYVSLYQRAKIANRHPQSLLLSIHFDGSHDASNDGFATYYFPKSPSGRFVARTILEALDESLDTRNRGTVSEDFGVLVRTAGCAVLVECGFLSNRAEAENFASAEGQEWLAQALALGIMRAKPVIINDPPETELAKCEVHARNLEERQSKAAVSAAPAKKTAPLKSASKRK